MPNRPLSPYHFTVEWGGTRNDFTEVSGLAIETDVIEYRDGASPDYTDRKMPGLRRYRNLLLRRVVEPGDNEFFDWLNTTRHNDVERRDLTVALLDEEHAPAMVWKVRGAFPVGLYGPRLRSDRSAVAIETLEVAHDGLVVENG